MVESLRYRCQRQTKTKRNIYIYINTEHHGFAEEFRIFGGFDTPGHSATLATEESVLDQSSSSKTVFSHSHSHSHSPLACRREITPVDRQQMLIRTKDWVPPVYETVRVCFLPNYLSSIFLFVFISFNVVVFFLFSFSFFFLF